MGLQVLIIKFGGRVFQLYEYGGLTIIQWLISVGIGMLTIPVNMFLRVLPVCKPDIKTTRGQPLRKLSLLEEYND